MIVTLIIARGLLYWVIVRKRTRGNNSIMFRVAAILIILTIALTGCGTTAESATATPPDVTATESWARPTVAADQAGTDAANAVGGTSAAYVTLTNAGGSADALISAATDVAGMVMIHETTVQGEMASMHEVGVNGVVIAAGATVVLKPKATHIMLMDLQRQLVEGETIEITLTFQSGKTLTLPFKVENRE
jgi:hypothetical protein